MILDDRVRVQRTDYLRSTLYDDDINDMDDDKIQMNPEKSPIGR